MGKDVVRKTTPKGAVAKYFSETVLTYEGEECLFWPYAKSNRKKATIKIDGRMVTVARVVCEKSKGPPPTKDHQAAHSCGNGHLGCVSKKHLSWKTCVENSADKIGHGTAPRGEKNPNAILSDDDASAIRISKEPTRELASKYGVVRQVIIDIRSGKSWRHI